MATLRTPARLQTLETMVDRPDYDPNRFWRERVCDYSRRRPVHYGLDVEAGPGQGKQDKVEDVNVDPRRRIHFVD